MDLLERYLEAVKPLLPRKAQADILRELLDDILSQMEERSEQIGRPLTEEEQAEVIKKVGHPVVAAARYGHTGYLIGPQLFPFYWLTLKIAAVGALIVRSIVAVVTVLISPNPDAALAPALLSVPLVLVPVFCCVTVGFAGYEIYRRYFPLNLRLDWDPRSLPEIGKQRTAVPRAHSVAEIIFGFAGLIWWQMLPAAQYLALGPAAYVVAFGPIWQTLHWPVSLLIVAALVQSAVNLLRPHLTAVRARLNLLLRTGGLVLLSVALRSGEWVVAAPGLRNSSQSALLVHVVNQVLFWCIVAALIIGVIQLVWECVKQFRDSFSPCGAEPAGAVRRS